MKQNYAREHQNKETHLCINTETLKQRNTQMTNATYVFFSFFMNEQCKEPLPLNPLPPYSQHYPLPTIKKKKQQNNKTKYVENKKK